MDAYPALDELIWLFETEPIIEYDDVGWPASIATFVTKRGPWTVCVDVAPYMYTVVIRLAQAGEDVVHLAMREVVATVAVDRTHGAEAMVVSFDRNSRLDAVRLTLKPTVSMMFDTTRIWDD